MQTLLCLVCHQDMINHILLLSGQVGVGNFLLPWWVMQELEKFKFVLDYKIKELKKKIEPKEEQIADMKDQVKVRCAVLCCASDPACLGSRSLLIHGRMFFTG